MKLATYLEEDGRERVGVLSADGGHIHPLRGDDLDMPLLIRCYCEPDFREVVQRAPKHDGIPLEKVRLAAPIPHPRHDLICVGLNYRAHAVESARFKGLELKLPERPVYFGKRVDRAVAPGEAIPAHADITSQLDYEVELAVVIGKRCDHLAPEQVFDHIFGYTIVNDVSARDLQGAFGGQFFFSKGLDGFVPMGPWIVTADEFAAPPHLRVTTRVNGELRQDGNTSDFLFDIPYLVSQLSAGMVLEPGDILITGTPAGVGMGFDPPKFLRPGDVVECEIEGIGVLRNPIR